MPMFAAFRAGEFRVQTMVACGSVRRGPAQTPSIAIRSLSSFSLVHRVLSSSR
jgi:hypothetical protein